MAARSPREMDVSMPADLESATAKLVYLYVASGDATTVEQLCEGLDLTKGTVLSITGTLRERGYLERTESGFEPV